jgi:DNA-binding NtrC family response regulator
LEGTSPAREQVRGYEAQLFQEALAATGWNRNETAKRLGIPVRTLSYRMKVLGLKKP